jgi:AraC family transcriptional regulator
MVDNDGNAGGMYRKPLEMDGHLEETPVVSKLAATRSRECMHRVISLLEAAVGQLHDQEHAAQVTLVEAASLLRQQVRPSAAEEAPDGGERLLAWQTLKVSNYIDSHITGQILVADLCALVQRSAAHFSRSFKRTFGESPHAFVVRRRVEVAAQYMLTTNASLSDIALRCGFTDHAHLCKQFRQAAGQTPAAWRRAHRSRHDEDETGPVERLVVFSRTTCEQGSPARSSHPTPRRAITVDARVKKIQVAAI